MSSTRKITQLPAATGVTGVDVVPLVQGGVTRRATVSQIVALGGGGGSGSDGPTGPTGPAGSSGGVGPTGPAGAGEAYQSPTAPAVATAGATWFDTANGKYFVRFADLWVEVGFRE